MSIEKVKHLPDGPAYNGRIPRLVPSNGLDELLAEHGMDWTASTRQLLHAMLAGDDGAQGGRLLIVPDPSRGNGSLRLTLAALETLPYAADVTVEVLGDVQKLEGAGVYYARHSRIAEGIEQMFEAQGLPDALLFDEPASPAFLLSDAVLLAGRHAARSNMRVYGTAVSELACDLRRCLLEAEGIRTVAWTYGPGSAYVWQAVAGKVGSRSLGGSELHAAAVALMNLHDAIADEVVPPGSGRPLVRWWASRG